MIKVYSYEEMEKSGLLQEVLEEMRHFGYARYDSFEGFDCVSVEMLDYENLLLSRGSVLFYLEKERMMCFTSQKEEVEKLVGALLDKVAEDRLIYAFLDEITKKDDIAFETIEREIMCLEEALITEGKRDCVPEMNVLDMMIENENDIFDSKTLRSFRMLSRRTERRFQNVLNLRESVTQVRESYEAEVDISLNMTMKIFTVVTTIFLPLTLIVGWYGMNFDMPEYGWPHGYLFVTVVTILCIGAGILFFRKKKWF